MACKTKINLSDQLNDIEVDMMVQLFNEKLAPAHRESLKCNPMTTEELVSIIEAIDGGHAPSFSNKFLEQQNV